MSTGTYKSMSGRSNSDLSNSGLANSGLSTSGRSEPTKSKLKHEAVINRVRSGESEAFALIVADFQDIALASAYAWLGDAESARDVVQEAFLDAYLKLEQLREPAAFPGWFRRIVLKHCDRQSRRKALSIEGPSVEGLSIEARSAEIPSDNTSLLNLLIESKRDQEVRQAVELLPQEQRWIVALHYFSDVSGQQIADFLELPLSTVKKRLRVARKRLKQSSQQGELLAMKNLKAKSTVDFPDEIALFIAIREKNQQAVVKLLAKTPALVDAEQNWDRDLVYNGTLPFSTRATALITTIELDDPGMLGLLIDNGANPDGMCGCATGEAPLWAAALLNRIEHVALLLSAGANPNIFAASGNTPLHIAAMRGHREIVELLLANGANPEACEKDGEAVWPLTAGATKTVGWQPIDWALHNDHQEIVALLEKGRKRRVSRGAETCTTVIDQDLLETGIKALDFFSPLHRGGFIRIPFKAGVGMMVLLGELNRVFLSHENGAVVWTGFTQAPFDIADLEAEMCEFGLVDRIHTSLVSYNESAEDQREGFTRGLELIAGLQKSGKEVLTIIQSAEGFEADVEQAIFGLSHDQGGGAVTSLLLTPFRDEDQSWSALKAPYTSQISLDRSRSIRNLYPGIDPALSMSKVAVEDIGEQHYQLLAEVRELLAWYRLQDAGFDRLEEMSTDLRFTRAQQLIHYFTQPFKITEPFRGTPGLSIPRAQMLHEVQQIMDGSGPV